MSIETILADLSRLPGVPGYESGVNGYVKELFSPYADEIRVDALQNVIARVGHGAPRVMLSAHQDEIGLVVTQVLSDGSLRFWKNGGVDPRVLPAMEVTVLTKDGPLFGVIGAKPPHLLTDGGKNVPAFDEMFIDVGLTGEAAASRVRAGDMVVFRADCHSLAGTRFSGKTLDDRAGIAAMLEAAMWLVKLRTPAETYCVASTQEEVGLKGAGVAAAGLAPDFAIAVDVSHAEGPGTGKWQAYPMDKLCIASGPNLHPMLSKRAERIAGEYHIPFSRSIYAGATGTDAWSIQVAGAGVPCLLLSIPLRYMHTTVETLDTAVIRDVGRLMALVIDEMAREWEGVKWY